MKEYHKINTIFKRDIKTKKIILGDYSIPEFDYLKNCNWIFTEKVDGTNIRIMWDGKQIRFGGKTDNANIPVKLLYNLTDVFNVTDKFIEMFGTEGNVCLYGEGYGAGIQKGGGNYNIEQKFVLFDIKIGEWWLLRKDVEDIATKLKIGTVPTIGNGTLFDAVDKVKNGFNSVWGNFSAEGIVARPEIELKTRRGDRVITKIKHGDFS